MTDSRLPTKWRASFSRGEPSAMVALQFRLNSSAGSSTGGSGSPGCDAGTGPRRRNRAAARASSAPFRPAAKLHSSSSVSADRYTPTPITRDGSVAQRMRLSVPNDSNFADKLPNNWALRSAGRARSELSFERCTKRCQCVVLYVRRLERESGGPSDAY